MAEYIDNTYVALDGVLLTYTGSDISLKIPCQLDGEDIRTIGGGSVMESKELQQAVVPDGVTEIGPRAFASCPKLMNVYVPYSVASYAKNAFLNCPNLVNLCIYNIPLEERKYRDLLAASRLTRGQTYISPVFPKDKRINDALAAADFSPASLIGDGIPRLFTSQSLADDMGFPSLQRNLDGFGFGDEERYMTETSAFLKLIAGKDVFGTDAASEKINDRYIKTGKTPDIRKTAVFTFDDGKTKTESGMYVITANVKIGYHFWQSKVPVILNGKQYYIYRRHYLSSQGANYIRRDAALFYDGKPVTNRQEARRVYAKYKLLSIL